MARVRSIVAELVAERPGLVVDDLAPFSMAAVTRFLLRDGRVTRLDATLDAEHGRTVESPADGRLLAATPDLGTVVIAGDELVLDVAGGARRHVPVPAADSATFLPSGRLLVTAPADRHRLLLIDPATGRVLDEAGVAADDAVASAVPHPVDGSVLVDLGEGQDGNHVLTVRADQDRLTVETLLRNRVVAGFSPTGDRLLVTPHPSYDERAEVLAWPGRRRVAVLGPSALDVGDFFDLGGFFLGDHRIVLKTYEHGLVLCDGDLRPQAWIELTGDVEELEAVTGLGDDTFAAQLGTTTVWRLPVP